MACTGPSLSGAFDILGAAGQDKLLYLKHKLKTLRPGCRGAYLLHAMVLLKLGQETEARISLEALKADAVAQLVAHQWAGVDSTETPEEPPDVSWAVARVYHLLAEEKLCPATMREEAYRAALRAFRSRDDLQLRELQEEARDRCGWDVLGDLGGVQTLRSDLGCLPPSSASLSRTRSDPRPIEHLSGWSTACSLRSTGSPASLGSNLEISQSPTMALLSVHHSHHGPSKLCDHPQASVVPEPAPMGCQEPEEMSWPPSVEAADSPVRPSSPGPGLPEVTTDACPASSHDPPEVPEISAHYPVECTDVPAAPKSLPSPSKNACLVTDQTPVQLSEEDTAYLLAQPRPPTPSVPQTSPSFPSPSTSPFPSPSTPSEAHPTPSKAHPTPSKAHPTPPKAHSTPPKAHPTSPKAHPTVWNPEPPPPELESSEQKFYNFVVLHASADEHIALRVRERLEALGVRDGATFCEDFQVPGRGELHCLQDALDHSAFIILLLTSNFDCRLSQHQTNQSLMSSLTRHGWQDCVIPFLPLESSLAQLSPSTSSLLTGLVLLDEHSKIFARKVTNTFKPQMLRARKAKWRKEQDARALREQSQQLESERQHAAAWGAAYSAYVHSYLAYQTQVEKLQVALANYMPFGTQLPFGGQGSLGTAPSPFPTLPGHQPPPLPPWLGGTPPPIFQQPPPTFPQPPPTFPQPPPTFPQPPPTFPQPPPTFQQPPPACPQPPDFSQAPPARPQSPGLQPLIIHHAQMVQLGVNNHMWNQRGTQAPEDNTRETE
ncbi:TIR domain-containing adapter molecule 1 [Bubalus bubalis]|uniref:TIR domain-containing adapter molecule 1 n=1 Tax=Bubalus bubalis TaxID=89462 RepID=UPI000DBC567A|nr:TIR domain-containing adapter molecule 1 [Bubalus bubalis]XP_006067187.4 TIR domain-containing adapter molecule 1 [Bubalus bubalis]XP_025149034.3 TIR domain-containing adapter molecule 1 [Bubalus bubalis]XP_045022575.1 TIR domain-containing adapter molecule 1 [Bubalus bubalis]